MREFQASVLVMHFVSRAIIVRYALDPSERPTKKYVYYVTGRGEFPFDMLRYDSAWPATGDDASKMDDHPSNREMRSIRLASYREPTIDRWSSFGWSVGVHNLESVR